MHQAQPGNSSRNSSPPSVKEEEAEDAWDEDLDSSPAKWDPQHTRNGAKMQSSDDDGGKARLQLLLDASRQTILQVQ